MRALVFTRYGSPDVLRLETVPTPEPRPHEVRVAIRAATVSAEDPKLRAFDHAPLLRLPIALLYGYPRPRCRILGMEFAGVVDAVGRDVRRFRPGDRVFGYTGTRLGAHAQYQCVPERGVLAKTPDAMRDLEAAALPNGALTALTYLRWADVRPGERVLVLGASGAVGTAAVQLAKIFGADVTGVCSPRNLEFVRGLGADAVLDYTREDAMATRDRYDVVFDTVGRYPWPIARRWLAPRGRLLLTVFGVRDLLRIAWSRWGRGPRVLGGASNFAWTAEDLAWLAERVSAGAFVPVVDRVYPWTEAAQAHAYVETGRKRGNVVLRIDEPDRPVAERPP